MKHFYLLVLGLGFAGSLSAQISSAPPAGGGGRSVPTAICVTPGQEADINRMLEQNRAQLIADGKLSPDAAMKTTAVSFGWPLKQAPGFTYYDIYGISNYVDHDTAYPSLVKDWNCGTRTYDLSSGYNHGGMDIFLWPFSINMMDARQGQIVAAAPGTILAKSDGNFDKNCAFNNNQWNAVYVQHSDGTVAWYGHMKSGSLTTKLVGASVAQGEYLGSVGSSGSSTGPHLHFEVHDAAGHVLDPYNGNCSAGASMWLTQKPYYESAINALMTNSAAPVLSACPNPDVINAKDTFLPGDVVYFSAFYHDQRAGQNSVHTVLTPDNSTFDTWQHTMTQTWYAASWWYWSKQLPVAAQGGTWHYRIVYQGKTYVHDFYVKGSLAVAPSSAFNGSLYPNPVKDLLYITARPAVDQITVCSVTGERVAMPISKAGMPVDLSALSNGLYFILLTYQDGHREIAKITVQR